MTPPFWNDVSGKSIGVLLIILSLMYITIFQVMDNLPQPYLDYVRKLNYGCLKQCDTPTCAKATQRRETGYWLEPPPGSTDINKCIFTTWELSHILFHVFIGYYYNIYISLGVGIGTEVFESVGYDCGSLLDLGYNMIGFIIGTGLRKYINPHM
jgi:hypothetical protein